MAATFGHGARIPRYATERKFLATPDSGSAEAFNERLGDKAQRGRQIERRGGGGFGCLLGRALDRVRHPVREDGLQREEAGEGCGSRPQQGGAGGKKTSLFFHFSPGWSESWGRLAERTSSNPSASVNR